jgi:ribonuclease BN (tRNA processing enzyme)
VTGDSRKREAVSLLVVLGSGGWIPDDARRTTCVAYRSGEVLFLFDAGSGLARLGREPFDRLIPPPHHFIHLFLSHFHIDHTVGLTYLPALWDNPTVIHVPPQSVLGVGPEALDALLGGPFFPVGLEDIQPKLSVETLAAGEAVIEGVPVRVRPQQHPGGSVGFRVGDEFALMTDTRFDPGAAAWVRGAKVLLHEAWTNTDGSAEQAQAEANGHSAAGDAACVARDAGVEELVLFHLPPFKPDAYHEAMLEEARAIFPATRLAFDGLEEEL